MDLIKRQMNRMLRTSKLAKRDVKLEPLLPTDTVQIYNLTHLDEDSLSLVLEFIDNADQSGIDTPNPVTNTEWRDDPQHLLITFADYRGASLVANYHHFNIHFHISFLYFPVQSPKN